jgi:hypothetical protein
MFHPVAMSVFSFEKLKLYIVFLQIFSDLRSEGKYVYFICMESGISLERNPGIVLWLMWLAVIKNAHNIHALVGIRTLDPSITSIQDYPRLVLRGQQNRHKCLSYQWSCNSALSGAGFRTTYEVRMIDVAIVEATCNGMTSWPLIWIQEVISEIQSQVYFLSSSAVQKPG